MGVAPLQRTGQSSALGTQEPGSGVAG